MILGMSLALFTQVHVAISLIGIAAGFLVIFGMFASKKLPALTALFLIMTVLTSVTGFFFPFHGITPGIVVGVISLVVLAVAVLAWQKKWATTYIVMATIAEFFNVLVLIVQSFQKIAPLHALAPKGTEPITNVAKVLALVLFVTLGWVAVRRGRFVL